jgi:putative hydrolase of the HAD superfamily
LQYLRQLSSSGGHTPGECLFVDDVAHNIEAARELGISAVQFKDNEQAIAEIESVLARSR